MFDAIFTPSAACSRCITVSGPIWPRRWCQRCADTVEVGLTCDLNGKAAGDVVCAVKLAETGSSVSGSSKTRTLCLKAL